MRLPALAEADERHWVETVFGGQSFCPKAGEALRPEREPPEMLAQLRRTTSEYNFAGQYQQAPSPQGAGMVKAAWFRNHAANERPEKFDQIVQSWDTRQQGQGAQRLQRGARAGGSKAKTPLSAARIAPAHGISRAEARCMSSARRSRPISC